MAEEPKKFFDETKKAKALKELNAKWTQSNQCNICGSADWAVAEDLVMPMPFTSGGIVLGGPSYPQLQVICKNCGNTHFFNAVILGIAPVGGQDGQ